MAEECKMCGACCMHTATPLYLPEEFDKLPTDIKQVISWFRQNDPDRGSYSTPCYFYSMVTRKCLIHENKPQVCGEFQAGSPDCLILREKYLIAIELFEQILDDE